MAKCKSCSRKKSKIGALGMGEVPTRSIMAAAGGAAAAMLVDPLIAKIPVGKDAAGENVFQKNPLLRNAIQLGLGIVMSAQDNTDVAAAGIGMSAFAAAKIVGSFLPEGGIFGIHGSGDYQLGSGPYNIYGNDYNYAVAGNYGNYVGLDGSETDPMAIYGDPEMMYSDEEIDVV
jgi:hypothetical protein